VGRTKDMIVASGFKVWPREVEDVLYLHPAVREAAVIGVPDWYRGETVKAVVSLKPGHTTTPEELAAFARQQLAAFKAPRLVEIVDELPKTASGKILRRLLAERDLDGAAAGGGADQRASPAERAADRAFRRRRAVQRASGHVDVTGPAGSVEPERHHLIDR